MTDLTGFKADFNRYLSREISLKEPQNLYAPITYILGLGGKQLRPILTLLGCDLFGEDHKKALDAAVAIEVFHNFSLVHDDIMDNAPLRRGHETVHEKWNLNTGILSGDAMLILAYQFFENYDAHTFQQLAKLFGKTALEVCEGQQYDVDFETKTDVTIPQYLKMIEYKTAVLIAAALQMGAIVANASITEQEAIYQFGKNLGLAFQLQDDYLDVFGDPKTFGKQVGGDIIENKKTFLYLIAIENSNPEDKALLKALFANSPENPNEKIEVVKSIFERSGAAQAIKSEIASYTEKANTILEKLNLPQEKKALLKTISLELMGRVV